MLSGTSANETTFGWTARRAIWRASARSDGPHSTRTVLSRSSAIRRARAANEPTGQCFAEPNAPPGFRHTSPFCRSRDVRGWSQNRWNCRSSSGSVANSICRESPVQPRCSANRRYSSMTGCGSVFGRGGMRSVSSQPRPSRFMPTRLFAPDNQASQPLRSELGNSSTRSKRSRRKRRANRQPRVCGSLPRGSCTNSRSTRSRPASTSAT